MLKKIAVVWLSLSLVTLVVLVFIRNRLAAF